MTQCNIAKKGQHGKRCLHMRVLARCNLPRVWPRTHFGTYAVNAGKLVELPLHAVSYSKASVQIAQKPAMAKAGLVIDQACSRSLLR